MDTVDKGSLKELKTQITDFSRLAIEQVKNKLDRKSAVDLADTQAELGSEKTKTVSSLEAFIATSPFTILEKTIVVRLVDGAYEARGIYRCAGNIQYDLLLDTKRSKILRGELRISAIGKEIKIPVSLAKNWLRKEEVPNYEKVDPYVLQNAEATANHLIVTFKHDEKDSKLRLVYSKHDSHSSLTAELIDSQKEMEITSNPGLNRFLDTGSLKRIAERLWESIADLENYKAGLTKLVSDDQNVLEKLDLFPFFAKSWTIISPKVVKEIKASGEAEKKKGHASSTPADDTLSEAFVRDKASSLGENSKVILHSLGMSS